MVPTRESAGSKGEKRLSSPSSSTSSSDGDIGSVDSDEGERVPLERGTAVPRVRHGEEGLVVGEPDEMPAGGSGGRSHHHLHSSSSSQSGGSSRKEKKQRRRSGRSDKHSSKKQHKKRGHTKKKCRRKFGSDDRKGKRRKRGQHMDSSLSRSEDSGLLNPEDIPLTGLVDGHVERADAADSGVRATVGDVPAAAGAVGPLGWGVAGPGSGMDMQQQQQQQRQEGRGRGVEIGLEEGEVVPSRHEIAAVQRLPARVAAAAALPHMATAAARVMWQVKLTLPQWLWGKCSDGMDRGVGVQGEVSVHGPAGQVLDDLACVLCQVWVLLAGNSYR
jgi:hypothetical protein